MSDSNTVAMIETTDEIRTLTLAILYNERDEELHADAVNRALRIYEELRVHARRMIVALCMIGGMSLPAYAQFTPNSTTTCNPFGTGVMCTQPNGPSTMITPMGTNGGMSLWSNTNGESGTIMTQPQMPSFAQPAPILPQVGPPASSRPSQPVRPSYR